MRLVPRSDKLLIHFEGYERVWAMKRSITVPRSSITAIQWRKAYVPASPLIRVGASSAPSGVLAGTFFAQQKQLFLYLKETLGKSQLASGALQIETRNYPLAEITLSVPEDVANTIISWWHNTFPPTSPSAGGLVGGRGPLV